MTKTEYKSHASIMKIVKALNLRDCGDSWDSGTLQRLEQGYFPNRFVVAKEDGVPIGWCAHFDDTQTHVYVREDLRNKGIGSKLLAHMTKKEPFCEVVPWSKEAFSFFKKNENLGIRFAY